MLITWGKKLIFNVSVYIWDEKLTSRCMGNFQEITLSMKFKKNIWVFSSLKNFVHFSTFWWQALFYDYKSTSSYLELRGLQNISKQIQPWNLINKEPSAYEFHNLIQTYNFGCKTFIVYTSSPNTIDQRMLCLFETIK